MRMTKENASRKIDSLGRVSVPKSMRDRLSIKEGDIVDFYLLESEDQCYVCFGKHYETDNIEKGLRAIALLKELGLEIPKELEKMV